MTDRAVMVDLDSSEAKLFETLLAWKRSHPQAVSPCGVVGDPVFDYGTVRLRATVPLPIVNFPGLLTSRETDDADTLSATDEGGRR